MALDRVASPSNCAKVSAIERVASAVYELFVSEPALLETVLSFIATPVIDKDDGDEDEAEGETQFAADYTFAAIVSLSRAFPLLGQQLGPTNESFWRSMVLRRFDFTVDPEDAFNVEIYDGEWEGRGPYVLGSDSEEDGNESEDEDEDEDDDAPAKPIHPIRVAINRYEVTHRRMKKEPMMLERDLAFWPSIGAHFRPAEYGFLGKIQKRNASIATWPEHEDAYTLYRDLALLQDKMGEMLALEVSSGNGDPVWPVLLSRLDGKAAGEKFELLRHCDFLPYFWDGTVNDRWSGLDHPLPARVEDEELIGSDSLMRTVEEWVLFPHTQNPSNSRLFECLRAVVHESFDDWRRVHANSGKDIYDYGTVEFFIGRSKTSGRWIGYVGEAAE